MYIYIYIYYSHYYHYYIINKYIATQLASDCGRVPIADAKQEVVAESLLVAVRVLVRVAAVLTSAGRRRPTPH